MALLRKKTELQVVVQDEGIALIEQKIAEMDAATERMQQVVVDVNRVNAKAISVTRELQIATGRAEQAAAKLRQLK